MRSIRGDVVSRRDIARTYGVLALLTAASLMLAAAFGKPRGTPSYPWQGTPQEWFLAWLGIFVTVAGIGYIVAVFRRRDWLPPGRRVRYPGLVTGVIMLAFYTALMLSN